MNCKFVFDSGIDPKWTAINEDGETWPVRDYYGTLQPECRRFPPVGTTAARFPSVAPDYWCGEWIAADDFEDTASGLA
jgi:hypothetical protein